MAWTHRAVLLFGGLLAKNPSRSGLALDASCRALSRPLARPIILRGLAGLFCIAWAFFSAAPAAAANLPADVAAKAAFIAKFTGYVGWPAAARPGPGQPFTLCVIGVDPFGQALERAARDEHSGGRGIQVRRLSGASNMETCHMAFVQGATAASTTTMLRALHTRPVLTITDGPNLAGEPRGIIHFVVHQRRVRFRIDQAVASRGGLSISSRLLAIALSVRREG